MQLHTKSVLFSLLGFFVQLIGYFSITFEFNSLIIKLHVNLVYLIRVNGESSINSDLIIQYFSLLLVTNYDFRVLSTLKSTCHQLIIVNINKVPVFIYLKVAYYVLI